MTKAPAPPAGKLVPNGLHSRLAANLKEARLAAGLSQRKLGEVVDLSPHYISQIEQALANPSLEPRFPRAAKGVTFRKGVEGTNTPEQTAA